MKGEKREGGGGKTSKNEIAKWLYKNDININEGGRGKLGDLFKKKSIFYVFDIKR